VAEFYLDHNVAAATAGFLRALGHGARTAQDVGLPAAADHRQLLEAARRGWVLVTYNAKDFRLLHDAWCEWPPAWGIAAPPQHAGVLVVPQPDPEHATRTPALVAAAIGRLAAGGPLANALHRWTPAHGWTQLGAGSV
jgi:Domain of unknown function (DUF5615)